MKLNWLLDSWFGAGTIQDGHLDPITGDVVSQEEGLGRFLSDAQFFSGVLALLHANDAEAE